jgi:ABC-type multidrug transport system fused ATPase/permease subunit
MLCKYHRVLWYILFSHSDARHRQITQSLNSIVRVSGEVETGIVSVERVLEYARLPSEAPDVIHHHRPPISWPTNGAIQYVNYSTRYRSGLT